MDSRAVATIDADMRGAYRLPTMIKQAGRLAKGLLAEMTGNGHEKHGFAL